jgi:hypothetical protein
MTDDMLRALKCTECYNEDYDVNTPRDTLCTCIDYPSSSWLFVGASTDYPSPPHYAVGAFGSETEICYGDGLHNGLNWYSSPYEISFSASGFFDGADLLWATDTSDLRVQQKPEPYGIDDKIRKRVWICPDPNDEILIASLVPTVAPTYIPTGAPTEISIDIPTGAPTVAPTNIPTGAPTVAPTNIPTGAPTVAPTYIPTRAPSEIPTASPTEAPTRRPVSTPITVKTRRPLSRPSKKPKPTRCRIPTISPTQRQTKCQS